MYGASKNEQKCKILRTICPSMTDCTGIVGFIRKMGNFHFSPAPRNQTFIISYFTPTTEYKNVQYMYGKLSLRALHTCIERDMYYRSYGVRFEKFGKKGPFLSVIIRGFALKKKIKKNKKK